MDLEAGLKVLGDIALADSMSYWIVTALTLLIFVVMRAMLPVKGLSFLLAPGIFWGGLAGIYALNTAGLRFTAEKAANTVLASAIGMIAMMVVMMVLLRALESAMRIRKPLARPAPMPAPRRVRL